MSFFKKKNKEPPKEVAAQAAEKQLNHTNSPTLKSGPDFGASGPPPQQSQPIGAPVQSGVHPASLSSYNRGPAGSPMNNGVPQNAGPGMPQSPPPNSTAYNQQLRQGASQLGAPQSAPPNQQPPPPQQQQQASAPPGSAHQGPQPPQSTGRPPAQNIIYPWSHRPLHYLPPVSISSESAALAGRNAPMPFPRYGHSVVPLANNTSNDIYIFGGLVSDRPSSDLYILSCVPNSSAYVNSLRERNPRAADLPHPGSLNIQWVETVGEVPGPRLGHASVGLGNVIITWGGDTNTSTGVEDNEESLEVNDDALYLLNLGTREWTRVDTPGLKPIGRYGHAAAIVGSRFFIFGGQSSGQVFMNDLWVFDLQMLKGGSAQWTQLEPNSSEPRGAPSQRTGHTIVTHGDSLYLFGGTDGQYHYNDTWQYNTITGVWTELQCSGYIPVPREGHSATLVNDTMYVFAGRGVDGSDLEDLAAFKLVGPEGVAHRWYMFQHMGPTPSGRSGHAMASWGPKVFVLGGESYNGVSYDPNFVNILDTAKIKYPTSSKQGQNRKSAAPPSQSQDDSVRRATSPSGGQNHMNGISQNLTDPVNGPGPSRGPTPMQQQQQPDVRGQQAPTRPTPTEGSLDRAVSPTNRSTSPIQAAPIRSLDSQFASSTRSEPGQHLPYPGTQQQQPSQSPPHQQQQLFHQQRQMQQQQQQLETQQSSSPTAADVRRSDVANPALSRSAPAQHSDKWLLAALSQAHASGYKPSDGQVESALTAFDAGKKEQSQQQLMSVVLALKQELAKAKAAISSQSTTSQQRLQNLEASRNEAVKEASYLKAKLAAVESGSPAEVARIEKEKMADLERRLAEVLSAKQGIESEHQEFARQLEIERNLKTEALEHAKQASARADASESSHSRTLSQYSDLQKRFQSHDASIQDHARNLSAMRGTFDTLQADHTHTKARLEASEGSLDTYLRTLEETQMAFNTVNAELTEMRTQCETARTEMTTAQHAAQSLRAELEAKVLEADQSASRVQELERVLDLVRQEKEALSQLTSGSLAELLAATKDNKAREESLQELSQQKLMALSAERDGFRDLHDEARDGHSAGREELLQAQNRHHDLHNELLALQADLSSTRAQHLNAQGEIAQLQSKLARQNTALDQHAAKLMAEETRSHTLRSILQDHGLAEATSDGSPTMNGSGGGEANALRARIRELENQIDQRQRESTTQLDQLRQQIAEQRALSPTSSSRDKATEAELAQLQDRHKGLVESHAKAVQYVKGTEKMLRRMKEEVNKHKSRSEQLEAQLAKSSGGEARSEVDAMRTQVSDLLRMSEQARVENKELSDRLATVQNEYQRTLQEREAEANDEIEKLKAHATQLEEQLSKTNREIENLKKSNGTQQALKAANERIESLRRQNEELEDRCQQAESRVGLLLDHFEKGETRSETSSLDDHGSRISAGSEFASDRIGALLGNAAPGSTSHDQHSLDSEELRSTFWKDERMR